MQFAILQNEPREGPGLIEEVLRGRGCDVHILHREEQEWLSLPSLSALVVMGGPQSANDTTPFMLRELAYVREAIQRGLPYLGVCLGLQVGVKAMGGSVVKNRVKEVAFVDDDGEPFTVELTQEGQHDPLLNGVVSPLPVFHLHGETVVPGSGMVTLGRGKNCDQQIVRIAPRAYGVQGHFEVTPEIFAVWQREDALLRVCDQHLLYAQAELLLPTINAVGRRIIENFFSVVA